mmetsp:Transcript_63958/g.178946  ORF Transcript_63958/g.178946 Transcript_63958/m.178946 type:complete len:921 (+) Transcript_63958:439-3201(+)
MLLQQAPQLHGEDIGGPLGVDLLRALAATEHGVHAVGLPTLRLQQLLPSARLLALRALDAWQPARVVLPPSLAIEQGVHIMAGHPRVGRVVFAGVGGLPGGRGLREPGAVEAEALSEARGVCALHGGEEPGDEGVHLLLLVPLHVDPQRRVEHELLRVPRALGQGGLGPALGGLEGLADDVADLHARPHGLAAPLHGEGDLHVRLVLRVRVVLRGLRQALGDDVALEGHLVVVHLFGLRLQEVVRPMNGLFLALPAENPRKDLVPDALRELAPISPDDVQALELLLEDLVLPIDDLQRGVLLLLEQHQATEHGIDLDLQTLVLLVHRRLDLLGRLHRLPVVLRLGVHEHGVRVAVDDVKLQLLLHDGDRGLEGVATPSGDQSRERLRVEPAVLKAQAAVHGVRGQLQRHLPDLQHLQPPRITLRLDRALHVPPGLDEAAEDLWQDALVEGAVRLVRGGEEVRLAGALGDLRLVRPVDRGEADVVLLDDGGVQAVEIQEHHELVVQAGLWLQDQAAAVGRLPAPRPRGGGRRLLGVVEACNRLRLSASLPHLAVGKHKLPLVELMAQEHLVALRSLVLQRRVPTVAREVGELLRQRQDLQRVRDARHAERLVEGDLGEVAEGSCRLVALGQRLRLHRLQALEAQVLAREGHEVVRPELRQQVLGLELDVADEAPRREAGAHPEAGAAAALEVRHAVLRPAQAAHLLPTLDVLAVQARRQHIQVEAVSAVRGDDVGVELLDLRDQGIEHSGLGGALHDAVLREDLLGVPGEGPRVDAPHRRPLQHAVAEVPVGLGRVGVEPGVHRARNGHGLVRLLQAALHRLHADAHHPEGRARRGHAHLREGPPVLVGLRHGDRRRGDPELDAAEGEPGRVLPPRAGMQADPGGAHDALLRHEALQQRCLRAEDVGEVLSDHVRRRHLPG